MLDIVELILVLTIKVNKIFPFIELVTDYTRENNAEINFLRCDLATISFEGLMAQIGGSLP